MSKGVNYHDVAQAALALMAAGEEPGANRVRRALGTGSYSTIAKHLRQFRIELAQNGSPKMPAEIPPVLGPLMQELWRTAVNRATDALDHDAKTAQTELRDLRDRLEAQAGALASATTRADMLQAALGAREDAAQKSADKLAQAKLRKVEAQNKLKKANAAEAAALAKQAAHYQAREAKLTEVAARERAMKEKLAQRLQALIDAEKPLAGAPRNAPV